MQLGIEEIRIKMGRRKVVRQRSFHVHSTFAIKIVALIDLASGTFPISDDFRLIIHNTPDG